MSAVVKLNYDGFAELRNSPGVMKELDAQAERIAAAAGEGFEAHEAEQNWGGKRPRARASVTTTDFDSMRRQFYHHILESALGGA